jgi:hypothetical protein
MKNLQQAQRSLVPCRRPGIERVAVPSAAYYTSHFFRGGQVSVIRHVLLTLSDFTSPQPVLQHCDETGKGRATEVQFYCCQPAAVPVPAGAGQPLQIREYKCTNRWW